MLLLAAMGKEAPFAVVLMTTDSSLRKRGSEAFYDNFCLPPKKNSSDMKLWKRALKSVIKMLKCSSSELMALTGRASWGRTRFSFRGCH